MRALSLSALLAALLAAAQPPECSVRDFATCSTTEDQRDGVAAALAAAAGANCTLVVDCALLVRIGVDIARPIFVESGSRVLFRGAGQLLVDNQMLPVFVFANVRDIELLEWRMLYVGTQWYSFLNGTRTINMRIGYYEQNGTVVPNAGDAPVGGTFNDVTLRDYYATHRNVSGYNPIWVGPNNLAAVFNFVGSTENVRVDGMLVNSSGTNAVDFVLNCFAFNLGFKSDQIISSTTNTTSATAAIPRGVSFTNMVLDGVYMGFVGSARDLVIANLTSYRYSDLQDPNGTASSMGGCFPENTTSCWYPPPHLIYFNFNNALDAPLWNANISISDVLDVGARVGPNHRIGTSGNCLSLKIGAVNSSVRRYRSARIDGAVDIVYAEGLSFRDMDLRYDSSFLQETWPAWRFTRDGYHDISFENIVTTDVAAQNRYPPMWGNFDPNNTNILYRNVTFTVNNLYLGITSNVTGQAAGSLRVYRDALTGAEMTIDENNVVRNVSAGSGFLV